MDAVITCIYDEGALEDTPLIGAKGFSVMVERDGRRVLFDTGLRDRYLKHNLENLEIDPESIDAVVVSQAHPDNCRALNGFLDLRETPVDVYAPAGLYQGKPGFLSTGVGVSDENRAKMNLRDDEGWIEVFPGITVTPTYGFGAGSERYLIVEGRRLNVISGRGIEGPARALEAVFERFGRPWRRCSRGSAGIRTPSWAPSSWKRRRNQWRRHTPRSSRPGTSAWSGSTTVWEGTASPESGRSWVCTVWTSSTSGWSTRVDPKRMKFPYDTII